MKHNATGWAFVLLVSVTISAAMPANAANITVSADILVDTVWTNDNVYFLDKPIYVTNGATLEIQEGTVIRGEPESGPGSNDPGTLVISRGSKLLALGTAKSPIVFTDLNDDNIGTNPGTPPYDTALNAISITAQWGGVILLGNGWVANNTAGGANPAREVQIEGLVAAGGLGLYGNCAASPLFTGDIKQDAGGCDDDDSGAMRYVSIRYGGFNLSSANEINGLTLGAVGRETALSFIEVFQNKDDGMEFFGGAAQIKNAIVASPGDDGVDYDEGFRGKGQFIFLMQGRPGLADKSDKGGEHDGGNSPDGSLPLAIPTFYNVTYVGHGGVSNSVDRAKNFTGGSSNTVMDVRDNAGTRYYNSLFTDWKGASIQIEGRSVQGGDVPTNNPLGPNTSAERALTTYRVDGFCALDDTVACASDLDCGNTGFAGDYCRRGFYPPPDSAWQLELRNNTYHCIQRQEDFAFGGAVDDDGTSGAGDVDSGFCQWGGSASKFCVDNGLFDPIAPNGFDDFQNEYVPCDDPLPIRLLDRFPDPDPLSPDPMVQIDPRPVEGGTLQCAANPDGCRPIPNDGFFTRSDYRGAFGTMNWAEGWTAMSRVGYFPPKPQVLISSDILVDAFWTADNEYILDKPIYITNGATLTIEQGTTVRGQGESGPGSNDPGTLVVARGSKINAVGTPEKPIVFTNLDDDNIGAGTMGSPPYDNVLNSLGITGTWGGVIVLGNGLVSNNTLNGPNPAREVQIEGLVSAGGLGLYGDCLGFAGAVPIETCDDDDSGVLRYASIRYGGFNLSAANEINGLTLGGVGRSTDVEFVEVYQNQDDGVENFGGAVELNHVVINGVGDDSLDYDEGWKGRSQFWWILQGITGGGSDKGGEHDGGNSPDGSQPFAIPSMANFTSIGLGVNQLDGPGRFTGCSNNTALNFRDNAGGRYWNSFFMDYCGASIQIEGRSFTGNPLDPPIGPNTAAERATTPWQPGSCTDRSNPLGSSGDACTSDVDCSLPETCVFYYRDPASDFQLDLQNNTFACIGRQQSLGAGLVDDDGTSGAGTLDSGLCEYSDNTGKFCYDNGLFTNGGLNNTLLSCGAGLQIRELQRVPSGSDTTPDPVIVVDPRPAPGSAIEAVPVEASTKNVGGGFQPTAYQGAFGDDNWATCWTNTWKQGMVPSCDPGSGTPASATPNPTADLRFVDARKLVWQGPECLFNTTGFDVLRSADPSDFSAATIKPQWDDTPKANALDNDVPPVPGDAFFYLTRANNACGDSTLGEDSSGAARSAP